MKKMATEITNPTELNALSAFSMTRRRGLGKLHISADFDHPDKDKLEKDLNKFYYACGCNTSAKFMMVGVATGLAYSIYAGMGLGDASVLTIGLGVGAAVLGKVVGLFKANVRLEKTVRKIQAHWKPKDSQKPDNILCG